MNPPIILTEDERKCIHRSLSLHRDAVREELMHLNARPDPTPQHKEAIRILTFELETIATCIRTIWLGTSNNQ